jgi:hypothetical protein
MAQSSSQSQSVKRVRGVPVSQRALEQRVGRLLAAEGKVLKRTRGELALRDLGAHYVVNRDNSVVPIDLEALAHELGALAGHERLVSD